MAPITLLARINGRRVETLLAHDQIADCVRDAVTGGGQIVALKRSGSATIAPAHASVEIMDHIRGARVGPVLFSVMLQGEYGIDGVVLGVPAHLGRCGLLEVEELRLTDSELQALRAAADAIHARFSG